MRFQYEAMAQSGSVSASVIDAANYDEATETLRRRGLMVLELHAAPEAATSTARGWQRRATTRDLLLFCRQMKMLLEAGSALVPALEAIEQQSDRSGFRDILRRLRERVEGGSSLNDAMSEHPDAFKPVFRSMIAAGEATASLPRAFHRLSDLTQRQLSTQRAVTSALMYPALLSILCVGVVIVLITFVVPRFRMLFTNLKSKLPPTTEFMFRLSEFAMAYWPFIVGGIIGLVVAVVIAVRSAAFRDRIDPWVLRVPLIGKLIKRLEVARVLRIWSAMLGSHVPLLDTIEQSRAAVTNSVFKRLLSHLQEAVAEGGKVGQLLRQSGHVEPIIASAIATGEENGRLAEATDFVSNWMDEDNSRAIATATRIAEPAMLAVMGAVVGLVAMGLFMPLFDIATAA